MQSNMQAGATEGKKPESRPPLPAKEVPQSDFLYSLLETTTKGTPVRIEDCLCHSWRGQHEAKPRAQSYGEAAVGPDCIKGYRPANGGPGDLLSSEKNVRERAAARTSVAGNGVAVALLGCLSDVVAAQSLIIEFNEGQGPSSHHLKRSLSQSLNAKYPATRRPSTAAPGIFHRGLLLLHPAPRTCKAGRVRLSALHEWLWQQRGGAWWPTTSKASNSSAS